MSTAVETEQETKDEAKNLVMVIRVTLAAQVESARSVLISVTPPPTSSAKVRSST